MLTEKMTAIETAKQFGWAKRLTFGRLENVRVITAEEDYWDGDGNHYVDAVGISRKIVVDGWTVMVPIDDRHTFAEIAAAATPHVDASCANEVLTLSDEVDK